MPMIPFATLFSQYTVPLLSRNLLPESQTFQWKIWSSNLNTSSDMNTCYWDLNTCSDISWICTFRTTRWNNVANNGEKLRIQLLTFLYFYFIFLLMHSLHFNKTKNVRVSWDCSKGQDLPNQSLLVRMMIVCISFLQVGPGQSLALSKNKNQTRLLNS